MHRLTSLALFGAALIPLLPAGGQAAPAADVRIAEVLADPDATQGQREFVEIWNAGNATAQLAGWKLRDAPTASGSTNTFTFPPWVLAPGARVVVWGGGSADAWGPAWSNGAVWNNAGDGATLLDATGNAADWMGYGTATPPSSFALRPVAAAAPRGLSLQLRNGAWEAAPPTPGLALGAVGGTLDFNVTNAAPTASFGSLPTSVGPGRPFTVPFTVLDPNGPADVASWSLRAGSGVLASGAGGGDQAVVVNAPTTAGPWMLTVTAVDRAGATASANAAVQVRSSDLIVEVPAGGLRFATAQPGQATVEGASSITIRNDGATALRPRLDVSSFQGPEGALPAEAHLQLFLGDRWTDYGGPVMALPGLDPGQSLEVRFRLHDLPPVLAAGAYGASFAVVPG